MKKVITASLITAALIDIALYITIGLPYIIFCFIVDIIKTAVEKYGKIRRCLLRSKLKTETCANRSDNYPTLIFKKMNSQNEINA